MNSKLRIPLCWKENEVDIHRRVVDQLITERGAGLVAMSDSTREALESGKRLPEFPNKGADELTADELKQSAHYYVRKEDGTFELATKADRKASDLPASELGPAAPPPLSADALGELRASMKGRLGAHADSLAEPALVALSKVNDDALKQLKTASQADLERLAAMLTSDPTLAERLAGKKNLLGSLKKVKSGEPIELDRVMFSQRLGDVKVAGKPDRLREAVERANLTGAQLDALSNADLEQLGKADAALARARDAMRPGEANPEKLKEALALFDGVGGGAARDELRAALSHVHGLSDIPFMLDPGAALRARFPDIPRASMDDLVARHPDALRALEDATEEDVRRVIRAIGESGDPKDVEDILRSYMYKAQKKARKGKEALEVPQQLGDRIEESVANLAEARKRGYPFGFKDKAAYDAFTTKLDGELAKRKIAGKAKVQGSAMHSKTPGDIDLEILVDPPEFQRLADSFRVNAPGGKLAVDLEIGIKKGKIPSFHFFPDHAPSIADSVKGLTDGLDVQATLIVRGSDFDVGPFLTP